MAQCLPSCSCEDAKGLADRYSDKIENVLADPKGRQYFRKFMSEARLKDGVRCLDFWERCDAAAESRAARSSDPKVRRKFLEEVDALVDEADGVEHLDFALMEKLTLVRDAEDCDEMVTMLRILKNSVADGMRAEYNHFRQHLLRRKSPH